jgi:hypothetical protein
MPPCCPHQLTMILLPHSSPNILPISSNSMAGVLRRTMGQNANFIRQMSQQSNHLKALIRE